MSKLQLSYKENYKGWVSFLTYLPDLYATLGNKFFTIKNGQVWEHNDIHNEARGSFYGELQTSKINFFINIENNEEVVFKTVMLEGNDSWNLTLQTNYSQGEITKEEFNLRESNYYAHFRQNELEQDFHGLKTNGIGILESFNENTLYFSFIPEEISIGDKLYCHNSIPYYVGIISEIGSNYLIIENIEGVIVTDMFHFATKDSRTEGSDLRGYYAEITLTNNNQSSVELFAVNTNISKSYV